MTDVIDWIEEAEVDLNLRFPRCPDDLARDFVRKAQATFVVGNPRVWWLNLKKAFVAHDSAKGVIADVLPSPVGSAYFIPEDGSKDLPMYELTPAEVELIRKNCPPFEYYYVEKALQWMVVESDHDEFIVTKRDNPDRR